MNFVLCLITISSLVSAIVCYIKVELIKPEAAYTSKGKLRYMSLKNFVFIKTTLYLHIYFVCKLVLSLGETSCHAHSDCPTDFQFCYMDIPGVATCQLCEECQYCVDGIDGTCGTCGAGFPKNEKGPCKADEGICLSISYIGFFITLSIFIFYKFFFLCLG